MSFRAETAAFDDRSCQYLLGLEQRKPAKVVQETAFLRRREIRTHLHGADAVLGIHDLTRLARSGLAQRRGCGRFRETR